METYITIMLVLNVMSFNIFVTAFPHYRDNDEATNVLLKKIESNIMQHDDYAQHMVHTPFASMHY